MSTYDLTVELLTTALAGLDELSEIASADADERRRFLTAVAHASLTSVAVSLKFVIAKHGEATLPGFGRFANVNGVLSFEPTPEFREYAVLTQPDQARHIEIVGATLIGLLDASLALTPHTDFDLRITAETSNPEERLLAAIFGETPKMSLREAVKRAARQLLVAVGETVDADSHVEAAGRIESGGVASSLDFDDSSEQPGAASAYAAEAVSSDLLDKSVEELELSVRAYNALKQANIRTLRDLVEQTEATILSAGFGRKSLNEIKEMLAEHGLSLGMHQNPRLVGDSRTRPADAE